MCILFCFKEIANFNLQSEDGNEAYFQDFLKANMPARNTSTSVLRLTKLEKKINLP